MRFAVRILSVFCLMALLVATLPADETKAVKKKGDKKSAKGDPNAAVFAFPKQIKLDDKQLAKVEELKKEYLPRLTELTEKYIKIMTPERAKAEAEATKAALDSGKSKKEAKQAGQEALKLSDTEKAQLKEIRQERKKLQDEIRTKKIALLTDEQKEALKKEKKPVDKKPTETKPTEPEKKPVDKKPTETEKKPPEKDKKPIEK